MVKAGSDDRLEDFTARSVAFDGITRTVYTCGSGPAVVVMPEMPGISPQVARFARWVRDAGFTVYMPSLFGRAGAFPRVEEGVEVFRRACVAAELAWLASGAPAPITAWLRALARTAHSECGGPGVGAIGMCFTGNYALTMCLDQATIAPVLAQPSLPLDDPAAVASSPAELDAIRRRLESDDLNVLAYRFAGDRYCTAARFAAYQAALDDRFVGRVLPDEAANPDPPPFFGEVIASPHSVVTAHLIDEAGQPTIAARDEILRFLAGRLMPDSLR